MGRYTVNTLLFAVCFFTGRALCNQRWCCKSQAEYDKCVYLRGFIQDGLSLFPFDCHYAESDPTEERMRSATEECMSYIIAGEADLMFLDGGDIYRYKEQIDIVAAEDYGEGDASYYAVAVVRKGTRGSVSMNNLNGLKSCHTGVGRTSGWNTPMGLIARKHHGDDDGDIQLYDPFYLSCAPGANIPSYKEQLPMPRDAKKWCALCIGDRFGLHVCDRSDDERYSGYNGALRCLRDGVGDIAFVKHTTVKKPEEDRYSLLCPNGTRASPSEWRSCNLARVPAHGLAMKAGTPWSTVQDVYNKLVTAMREIPAAVFLRDGNLLWKSSTKTFLGPFVKSPPIFLGDEYYCNMKALEGGFLPPLCRIP